MVIWVHNICYARFVFNKLSLDVYKRQSTMRSTNLNFNPGVGSSSLRLFAQKPSVR